jgi:hypothetical protein
MIAAQRRTEWRLITLAFAGLAAVAGIAVAGLVGAKSTGDGRDVGPMPGTVLQSPERSLPARLASVDAAIARRDQTRAIYEWRDAYSVALGSRRWEAMVAVGDAALRIDALAPPGSRYPSGFRAEARQAYLKAFLDARAAGSREGILRAAEAFGALGDAEMAARVRATAGER